MNKQPKYLWFLMLSYCMILVFSNWMDPRIVQIFGLNTDAGTIIFPCTFLLSDLITEVYGYKCARQAIWVGFLFNMLFISYGQLVIHLPSPAYAVNNIYFTKIMQLSTRVVVASMLSYLTSEPMNAYLMAKLKIKTKGKYLSLRFVASTVVSSGVDSFIFATIAFYGVFNNHNLLVLILTMWFIKTFMEIAGLPLSIYVTKKLKAAEKIDRYDYNTNFNLFSLDSKY